MLTSQEIYKKVTSSAQKYGDSNPQQLSQLESMISKSKQEEIFYGLYKVFTNTDDYPSQELAGKLLWSLKPHIELNNVKELIQNTLKKWDKSIEQLPWYFVHNYGEKVVILHLNDILIQETDEEIQSKIETWLYWFGAER